MLQKAFFIGVCFIALIGCTDTIAPDSGQPETEVVTQLTPQERESLEQERIRLAEEKERETRRQILASNIKNLEQQIDLLSQRMLGRQQKISNLELQVNNLETDLRTYNGEVESFITAHKTAIACMGAVGASLDESNQYSQDVKDIASVVTLACGFGVVLNEEFRNEVFFVVDQLTQADTYVKNLTGQLTATKSQLLTENESLESEKVESSKLASDVQNYQSQLEI